MAIEIKMIRKDKKRAWSHRLKNFFINHYDHPIFEDGIQLTDMIYLSKEL